jgi:hypothetical protein
MKTHLFTRSVALTGLAALLAFAPGCDEGDSVETGDEQDATAAINDTFANTVLAGGCSITVKGKVQKTKGTGGKCPTNLTQLLDAVEADTKLKMSVFAVSEESDLNHGAGTPFRFVIAVDTGDGKAEKLFFSTLGSAEGISETFIEVMAFNEKKGVYAYYDLEDGAWVQVGDGSMVKTDAPANGSAPAFACVGCHTTAAPIMKELHDSWINWQSTWFSMPNPNSSQALFNRLFSKVKRGDDLELLVIAGTKAHTKTRVDKAVKDKKVGALAKQLMCDIGEPSIIAAHSKNSKRIGKVETFSSMLPTSILLNNLLKTPSTGTGPQKGVDNVVNMNVPSLSSARIDAASYVKALETIKQTIGGEAGDAMFPMSSPEKSFADVAMVQELVARNLLDKDVVADALMVDFTTSTFSDLRCNLASTMPKNWTTVDELRTQWITALGSSTMRGAAGLKARLENKTDLDAHATKVETYVKACNTRGTSEKDAFALDLLTIMSQRRAEFTEKYESVVESPWLIPSDNLNSKPHAKRLNATTCKIENATEKFVGEDGA